MVKLVKSLLFIVVILLFLSSSTVMAQDEAKGFIATAFEQEEPLSLSNGLVDDGWTSVQYYQNITEFGSSGYVKFAHNVTHLYSLFVVDSEKDWSAAEFYEDERFGHVCMSAINDGWTFYLQDQGVDEKDTYYAGSTTFPSDDASQDLYVEVIIADGYHYIEIVRSMDTQDTEGNDFVYSDGVIVFVKFATDTHHKGGSFDEGPSELYYLSVQFSDEVVVPVVEMPIDFKLVKTWITFSIPFIVGGFISIHAPIRLKFRKVHDDHPGPLIDEVYKTPTLKDRLREDFWSKFDDSKSLESPYEVEDSYE